MELSANQREILLDVARMTIRRALGENRDWPGLLESSDPILNQPSGCFVTLHRRDTHQLRGCIGRLKSGDALLKTVRLCAEDVLGDSRFVHRPVTLEELPALDLEITVLSPLEAAANALDFDLLENGIYLMFGDRAGCFLPQVARETGWTKEQLLDRLCSEKMGLSPLIWRNPHARLFKFTATIVGPEPVIVEGK